MMKNAEHATFDTKLCEDLANVYKTWTELAQNAPSSRAVRGALPRPAAPRPAPPRPAPRPGIGGKDLGTAFLPN